MKAYLATTSTLFGLIVIAHVLRVVAEGVALAADPWFLVLTFVAAALCIWGFRLFRRFQRADQ